MDLSSAYLGPLSWSRCMVLFSLLSE
jgi:hypothetical protein